MALQYQFKEGSYHLYDMSTQASHLTGEHRLRLRTDNVALAFDLRTGVLHEHGSATRIHSWASGPQGRRTAPMTSWWSRVRCPSKRSTNACRSPAIAFTC